MSRAIFDGVVHILYNDHLRGVYGIECYGSPFPVGTLKRTTIGPPAKMSFKCFTGGPMVVRDSMLAGI